MRLAVALLAAAVVAASAAPRILLAAGALPDPLRPFIWSDALLVYVRGLSGHRLPYADVSFEYPPLIGLASGLFSIASDDAVTFVALWGVLQVLLAGIIAALLARAAGTGAVLRRFALAPQLLLLGAVNFDLLAVSFLTAALLAARARRDGRAIAFLALGTLSKLFPIAAVPVALARAPRPVRAALGGAAILAIGYLAAVTAGPTSASGPLYYLVGIDANVDSPWGLLAQGLGAVGVPDANLIVVALTLGGLAATYVLVLRGARRGDPVAAFGLAIVTVLVWSRLYSPQYSLWVLPLFVLLPLGGRLFALLAAGDVLVFATIYPLTIAAWPAGDPRAGTIFWALVLGVGLRSIALVGVWRALHRLTRAPAAAAA